MRRSYREVLMSVGSVLILLLTLTAFDVRVREQLSRHLTASPRLEVASVGYQLRDLTSVIVQAARDQSFGHAPLLLFALVSAVLLMFMLRT
jgi:hypothetical protein